jgi:hypothetical protein
MNGTSGGSGGVGPKSGTNQVIQQFIQSRYNNGFLNLEHMAQDPILKAARITPPGESSRSSSDIGYIMLKTAAQLFPDVRQRTFIHIYKSF